MACFGWQEATGRQDCHSLLITALLITDKLQLPQQERTLTSAHGSPHIRDAGQGHCAPALTLSLSLPHHPHRSHSPCISPPPTFHPSCFPILLSLPGRTHRSPTFIAFRLLMLPHCLAPVFTCLASLGHGCVCLRSKKTIVGTGGLWYLQPANRDHDPPPRTPQVALAFFFAPVAGKRTVFSRSSLLGRLTHQVSHLHGGGEGLVKSYVWSSLTQGTYYIFALIPSFSLSSWPTCRKVLRAEHPGQDHLLHRHPGPDNQHRQRHCKGRLLCQLHRHRKNCSRGWAGIHSKTPPPQKKALKIRQMGMSGRLNHRYTSGMTEAEM